jgi:hypothetical protein
MQAMPYQMGVFGTRAAQEVSTAVGVLWGLPLWPRLISSQNAWALDRYQMYRETVQVSYIDYFPLQPIAIKLALILLFDSVIQF